MALVGHDGIGPLAEFASIQTIRLWAIFDNEIVNILEALNKRGAFDLNGGQKAGGACVYRSDHARLSDAWKRLGKCCTDPTRRFRKSALYQQWRAGRRVSFRRKSQPRKLLHIGLQWLGELSVAATRCRYSRRCVSPDFRAARQPRCHSRLSSG